MVQQRCSRGQTSRRAPLALRTALGAGPAVARLNPQTRTGSKRDNLLLKGPEAPYYPDMQNRDEDSDELSLLIRCQEDRDTAVRLHSRYLPDECGIGFAVDARADGLQAQLRGVEVWVWDDEWLPDFIARLAADYRAGTATGPGRPTTCRFAPASTPAAMSPSPGTSTAG